MAGRTIETSIEIRREIQRAVDAGCGNPAKVMQFIEKRKQIECPTLMTVIKIMRQMGFVPVRKWVKEGEE